MESVDSAAQEKYNAGDLLAGITAKVDALSIDINRVSPSGKYLSRLRIHRRIFPLWWKWETVAFNVTPGYNEAFQVLERFINQMGKYPTPVGTCGPNIVIRFGAIYGKLPDGME